MKSIGQRSVSSRAGAVLAAGVILPFTAASIRAAEPPTPAPAGAAELIKIDDELSAARGVRVRNLEVFALIGPDQIRGRDYLTLSEAMERKLVQVTETQNVSELKIANSSPDRFVFIQAGDIVKGGQQDRCLTSDLVLAPKSGAQPIGSFCVEQGRWTRRGAESVAAFSKSDKQLVTSAQRYAAKAAKRQDAVWNEVEKSKKALTSNVSKLTGATVNVEENASPSSLQLALENPKLAGAVKDLRAGAAGALPERTDIIGVAYAINGKLVNAEVYGNAKLFAKLRHKILDAAATEAIAELKETPPSTVADSTLREFLSAGILSRATASKPNRQTECREREEAKRALYESRDVDFKDAWCHRNMILADEAIKKAAASGADGQQAAQQSLQEGAQQQRAGNRKSR
jgi:hypothetical protein